MADADFRIDDRVRAAALPPVPQGCAVRTAGSAGARGISRLCARLGFRVRAGPSRSPGDFTLPLPLKVMGWACTLVTGAAAGGLLFK